MKIHPAGDEFSHAERETDGSTVNLMTSFDNFANAPKRLRRI